MRYELWLGLRYLFAKRRERFISLIAGFSIGGVALGVAALIVVLAVMSGFNHDITDKLVGTNAHLIIERANGITDPEPLVRRVSGTEHVVGVSPYISGQAILRLPDRAFGVLVRGIDTKRESRVNRLADYVVVGRLPVNDDEVLVGTELAAFIGAGLGAKLKLISPADGETHEMKISGIFRSGMYEYDANLIAMNLKKAQGFFKLGERVSGIGVKLDKLELAPEVERVLQAQAGPSFDVKTWQELNPALFGALRVEKTVMFIILTLIIVVAALNITSMLIMIVMEKTKDIGILRSLGATRGSVALLFLWQGCAIGAFGISLGLAGGVALARNLNAVARWLEATWGISVFPPTVYYLDHIPAQVNGHDVFAVVSSAFLLSVVAGTYAAIRAAALPPVEALRYE